MNPQLPSSNSDLPVPGRIVVRGVNWLGDALMTVPALVRLRERFPAAHLALVTPAKLADLWRRHPAVDEVIAVAPGEGPFAVGRRLQSGKFDVALVLPNSPRAALETWLAQIPQRIGYARPWRNWLLTAAVPPRAGALRMRKRSVGEIRKLIAGRVDFAPVRPPTSAHQAHDYLHLAAALGADPEPVPPLLAIDREEVDEARKKFQLVEISQPIFGLNPGAEYGPAKRWPAERFAAAAREIRKRTGCCWLLFGGPGDAAITGEIQSALNSSSPEVSRSALNLAGRTSLRELCALLKLCRVLLANDTGPMHVAAALGTPVVVPFGSTSPELTGPGLPGDLRHHLLKSNVPCSPCFLRECPVDFRCMRGIGVESVVAAVLQAAG